MHEKPTEQVIEHKQAIALQQEMEAFDINRGVMWAFDNSFSTIKEATYNPQMYRDLALLTELTSQNTWDLQSHVGMPLNYQEGSMSQDARLQLKIGRASCRERV